MSKIQFQHGYQHIISLENLLAAWKEFVKGKRSRKDVQEFERNLMANIILLHRDLAEKTYIHSAYQAFKIADPKPRDIHKATVRDRLLHHALHRELSPFFIKTFIADSYSCQEGKGTHRVLRRFKKFSVIVSQNNTRTAWILKGDIRKFFASIDQRILIDIVKKHIPDQDIIWLLGRVVSSFESTAPGKGLPLGNLTSQLLVNVYMNEFDQFMKHRLKSKYYIRYADDFVIMSRDKGVLLEMLSKMREFLQEKLALTLHPDKTSIQTAASGVDFLGWMHFSDHRVLRTNTKRRMFKKLEENPNKLEVVQSYLGLLRQGNTYLLQGEVIALAEIKKESLMLLCRHGNCRYSASCGAFPYCTH